jgi:hypothetical protein
MGKAKGPRKKTTPDLGELGNLLDRFRTSMDNLDKIEELEKSMEEPTLKLTSDNRFEIDTDKIETLDDVKEVIKAMQMTIYWYSEECPDKFKKLLERNLLKEIKDENI